MKFEREIRECAEKREKGFDLWKNVMKETCDKITKDREVWEGEVVLLKDRSRQKLSLYVLT